MLKRLLIRLFKATLLLSPLICMATTYDNVASGLDYFNFTDIAVDDDLSMTLLGMIFGNFNDMLPATGYSVLTPVLQHFNQGVFAIAVGMVTYVTFLSTIKTAEEGKPMGEKTPIFWMILRPIIGTTLLIPTASGYSYLQSFMMWAIISGVSFANSIFFTAANTFNQFGSLSGSAATGAPAPTSSFDSSAVLAQYMFESELCFLTAQNEYNNQQNAVASTTGSTSGVVADPPSSIYNNSNYTLTYSNLPSPYTCGQYDFQEILGNVPECPPSDTSSPTTTTCSSYSADQLLGFVNSITYSLYMMSKSLAQQQYNTMNRLIDVDWATNTTICQTAPYSGTDIRDLNCNLGLMIANNAAMTKMSFDNLIELTAVPQSTIANVVNTSGGWLMAAAAYFTLVTSAPPSGGFDYATFSPKDAFITISQGTANIETQQLCYPMVTDQGTIVGNNVPSDTSACNIFIPESFLQYTDSDNNTFPTNWLQSDIDGNPGSQTTISNVPKYMQLFNNQAASRAVDGSSYAQSFNYGNSYQAEVCQSKGFLSTSADYLSAITTASTTFQWNQPSSNCQTMTSFTTPSSGTVDPTNLPAVLSAQIYATAINIFGGQDVNSGFQSQVQDLVNATKGGVQIKGEQDSNQDTTPVNFSNSGVKTYGLNQIPQLPTGGLEYAEMILGGIFSSWDTSGSGSKFYDIYNNYIASILMQWQISFLNTNSSEPISAVRDFGINAISLSIQFVVAMTQKIYMTQVLIMVKYIGYLLFFTIIGATGNVSQGIIYTASILGYWILIFSVILAPFAYPVKVAIYSLAAMPQMVIQPIFNALANVTLLFLQLEIKGTFLWVPTVMSTAVPIMTLAMVLAFYAPMVPFLIWCLASINWLIGVIESMVAAPVVALGITSPQGHDFLGKSELFLMLLLAVFIRPAGMIFGLMFAVFIAYFGFSIFNYMIFYTMQIYLNSIILTTGGKAAAVLMGFLLFMYCYTVITFINQVFSMIYQIPNKIMRWIGVPVDEPDEEQWLEEIKGGVTEAAGGIAGSAGGAAEEMAQGGMAKAGGDSAQGASQNMQQQAKSAKDMKSK